MSNKPAGETRSSALRARIRMYAHALHIYLEAISIGIRTAGASGWPPVAVDMVGYPPQQVEALSMAHRRGSLRETARRCSG